MERLAAQTDESQDPPAGNGRFRFGKNWRAFLNVLTEERILEAERSLGEMLGKGTVSGASFLDVGSGSGLFSLAAMRLGARRVTSFDYDPDSVSCTLALKSHFFPDSAHWLIERGNVLDPEYVRELGVWDIVYSWGVLHHTGNMWEAMAHTAQLVRPGGSLFIAIYNKQRFFSGMWRRVKRLYNAGPTGRAVVWALCGPYFVVRGIVGAAVQAQSPVEWFREYQRRRGMSYFHDVADWLGGYPFEAAKPEEIFDFFRLRGFTLGRLTTRGGGTGCNEFVFVRERGSAQADPLEAPR